MDNSWKDFFTFSRKEQNGMAVLLAILLVLIILNPLIPQFFKKKPQDMEDFRRQAQLFMAEMKRMDSINNLPDYKDAPSDEHQHLLASFLSDPFNINPNTASKRELLKTGLNEFAINNLISYRAKGGFFKNPEDVSKIYGLKEDWLTAVSPYFVFERTEQAENKGSSDTTTVTSTALSHDNVKPFEIKEVLIELNAADSNDLMSLTGIGPAFARRILAYRNLLGGYYDKRQLLEVYGMDTSRYNLFKDQTYADSGKVLKMNLNTTGFKEMLRHPYFDYYLVKSIFNLKGLKKELDSIQELKALPEIYPELYQKISPYLETNKPSGK